MLCTRPDSRPDILRRPPACVCLAKPAPQPPLCISFSQKKKSRLEKMLVRSRNHVKWRHCPKFTTGFPSKFLLKTHFFIQYKIQKLRPRARRTFATIPRRGKRAQGAGRSGRERRATGGGIQPEAGTRAGASDREPPVHAGRGATKNPGAGGGTAVSHPFGERRARAALV